MSAFRVSVFDKNRQFQCQIGNPAMLSATPRHNLVSTATMAVPLNHRRIPELMADGARLGLSFMGEHLMSGPITDDELVSDGKSGLYTVTMQDDKRILWDVVGFPVPGSPVTNQSAAEYRTYTGNAETILKTAVTENGVTRLAIPGLTVAANLNRGATIPGGVPLRMHPLADQMFPAIEEAGLGVTVQQQGTNLVLDVYEPVTHPRTLSVNGRTLKEVRMTRSRPKASRVIVGGQGEGTLRKFRSVTDTSRESLYGMIAETFRDARDDNTDAVLDARGQETLAEMGPKNGVALTLAGSGIFRYGPGGFHVGDRIPVKIADGLVITEVLRECTLTWVSKDYAKTEPIIGERTNDPHRVTAQRIAEIARAQRNQERR